jgi:aminopeptidase N
LTFEGTVGIKFSALGDLSTVALNSIRLNIHNLTLLDLTDGLESRPKFNLATSSLSIYTAFHLGHDYLVTIDYSGRLSNSTTGLLYNNYLGVDGEIKYLVATVFEPNFTPQMFPCFDEISRKATFNLTAVVPKTAHVYHNTDALSIKETRFRFD